MRYDIWNLGSSSEGNCFIVKHRNCPLSIMIECGLNENLFHKRLAENSDSAFPSTILVSHEHQDHCRAWKKFCDWGCYVFSSAKTAEALKDTNNQIESLTLQEWQPVNSFYEVFPLAAVHDAAEPLMYLIRPRGWDDILLFAIDTAGIDYDLSQFNITDALVECNFMEELISEDVNPLHIERVRRSHMSLDALTDFFERQKFPNLQQITLCHLSQSNCDPKKAKETIMAATGVPVRVCAAKGGFIGN